MSEFALDFQTASPRQRRDPSLYGQDYHAWLQKQISALRDRRWDDIDIENLIDEIEDLGKSERRSIRSHHEVLHMHLLKWLAQPERRGSSWEATIKVQRIRLAKLMEESPSLRHLPYEKDAEVHAVAVLQAISETNLPPEVFPDTPPFTVDQVLDPDFWPR